jgi:hypothetical protein
VALVIELEGILKLGLGHRTWSRGDGEILPAVDLEGHGGCREARPHIDLPQLFQSIVVEGGNGAVEQRKEDQPARGRERARIVRVFQVRLLLDLAGDRVDGGKIALEPIAPGVRAAVPSRRLAVLVGVDGHVDAGGQRRDVDELRVRAVRGREVVVAAGDREPTKKVCPSRC